MEKQERHEKEHGEHIEEKWQRDPLSGVIFGLMVILLGVLLLLAKQGTIEWENWWAYLLFGIGCLFVLEVVIRYAQPAYRRPVVGKLVAGLVLIAIGASHIYHLRNWWPVLIIVAGIIILLYGLRTRRP